MTEWNGVERSGTEGNGGERRGTEGNGGEIRRLYLRGFRPPTTGLGKKVTTSAVYIYLRSNLTAGAPGSTFFFALNPDVREIVHLLNKIEMLFKYCPLHQRINLSDK